MNILEKHRLVRRLDIDIASIQWPNNVQEPDYVAKLVEMLPGIITNALRGILPRRHISVGGAFIHQKPLAHFTNKPGYNDPELGDLLIVCREKRASGFVYNAMLLQAKKTRTPLSAHIPNDHQFVLYSEWPEFEYKRAGWLNGKRRSVLPKTISQGAQYLLIKESPSVDLLTATVDVPLCGSRLFAYTLASILSFDDGRTFQATNPRDDWSQMILDLLRLSASYSFNRRNSGYVGANRWNGDTAFNYFLNADAQDNTMNELKRFQDVKGEESQTGISVICVDLGDKENNE